MIQPPVPPVTEPIGRLPKPRVGGNIGAGQEIDQRGETVPDLKPFRSIGYSVRIHAGDNAMARLSEEADRVRAKRAFVVCGQTVARRTDLLDRVKDALGDCVTGVFGDTQADSPVPSVEKGVAMAADAGANLIVAVGVVSALAHSLDTRYPACDHGAAYSIFTAPGMQFNLECNVAGQARLALAMGARQQSVDDRGAAIAAADAVADAYRERGMPSRLSEVGVDKEGIKPIAEDSMTDFALHHNVRPVREATELEELLREIW